MYPNVEVSPETIREVHDVFFARSFGCTQTGAHDFVGRRLTTGIAGSCFCDAIQGTEKQLTSLAASVSGYITVFRIASLPNGESTRVFLTEVATFACGLGPTNVLNKEFK